MMNKREGAQVATMCQRGGILLTALILLVSTSSYCQWNKDVMRNNKWYFSTDPKLNIVDFTNASSTQLPLIDSSPIQSNYQYASRSFINDTSGNLLFYSNGGDIYDKTFSLMQNGDSITPIYPDCLFDGVLILPQPDNDSIYYVFSVTNDTPCVNFGQYIYYSVVNANANNGKGTVISKGNLLFSTNYLTKGFLKAVRHGNGRDWWLVIKNMDGNGFYRFLFTKNGIQNFPLQTIGLPFIMGDSWQAEFSPKGDKFAMIAGNGTYEHDTTFFSIYDFDRCTGLLSNPIQYPIFRVDTFLDQFAICFSPDNKMLYWSNADSIFQYDLVTHLSTNVAVFDSTNIDPFYVGLNMQRQFVFHYMEPGSDGRIYLGTFVNKLHYINHPNVAGVGCDVHQNAITIPSIANCFNFNVPNYSMPPVWGSACDTLTGISEYEIENDIGLYPNPTNDRFTIQSGGNFSDVKIYTLVSELVYEKKTKGTNNLEISTMNLSPGIYIVRIDGKYVKKLVVER